MKYDVFISFKNLNDSGEATEDSQLAAEVFKELDQREIKAFYSNIRLFEFGEAAYKEAIEKALDEARIMIVIATSVNYLRTRWVSYERESFHEDILSGRKTDGVIVPYLKNVDGNDIPRSLRGYETFHIGQHSVAAVVDFVVQCLKKTAEFQDRKFEKSLTTGKKLSTYNPTKGNEFRRLKIQALNTRPADMPAIEYVQQHMTPRKLRILDAGCAYGFVTLDRFGRIPDAFTLAVDINEKCIGYARENHASDAIAYELLNLEDEAMEERLEAYMQKYHIERFDIIYASLVLHHLKNPNKFLRRIRRYLASDGYIIIRGSDDGSILSCNDDGLVDKVVEMHLKTDGISDRYNGRKIYSQLISSGYKDVRMMNYVKDLSGLDLDERYDVFLERFSYRKNYLKYACEADPYDMQKRNALEAMEFALDRLENKFSEDSFWYCEVDFVGVARKR